MRDIASSARAIHARAKERLNAGEPGDAERILLGAIDAVESTDDRALIDGTLAFIEAETGRIDRARARCQDSLASKRLGTVARARLRGQLGYVEWTAGNTHEAIQLFSDALQHLSDDERDRVLNNRGVALLTIGELGAAAVDFHEGRTGTDPIGAAKCAHNLGYVQLLRGDLVSAIQSMDGARPGLSGMGPFVTAAIDIDRVEALMAAGLAQEAVGLLREVRIRLTSTDLWRLQAEVESRLAALVPAAEGVALAESAAARHAMNGDLTGADAAHAVALHIRTRGVDPPTLQELDDVAKRLDAADRAESARALRIRAAGLRGDSPESPGAGAPLTTRLMAGEVGAEVALAKGDVAGALRSAGGAIDELEAWQRSIGSLELQNSTLVLGGEVILLGQQAALASGQAGALLEWSERAREVAARGVPSRPPEELGELLARLRHLGPEGDPEQRARLIEQIRHGRWHAEGSVETEPMLTLGRLQGALGDTRYVSIMAIGDQVVAFAVESGDVTVHRLGPWDRLDTLLGGMSADLTVAAQTTAAVVRRSLVQRLEAVDAILAPAFTGASHVVLTVPEELARVPWGQLDSLRGVAVSLPLSATSWVRAAQEPARSPGSIAVVVGPGTDTGKAEADAVRGAWDRVAKAEAHHHATCEEVCALAGEVDVLHISAHGRDRDGHRLFAATELYDGEWFGHDVELLPRVPDVVVLSACGVGGGSLGMARAWLHAGARHVIAAPADIAEHAAAERFPQLHALLAAGVSPERAVTESFGPEALDCAVQCYGPSHTIGVSG